MKILQHPRGTTGENDIFVGSAGQITVDTSRWEIRLHDGETPGGHRILNLAQLLLLFMSKDSEFGDVGFDEGDRGILTRIGDRQWALREIVAGSGITITNGLGTDGNFTISASGGLSVAGSIPTVLTTGTAAALLADLPDGWPDSAGAIALLKFHVAPSDGATLKVDTGPALPLITTDGSNNVNEVLGVDGYGLVVRYADEYILVGLQTPQGTGITDIANLTAMNVQDALEELTARLVAIENEVDPEVPSGASLNSFMRFAGFQSSNSDDVDVPLLNNECVFISTVVADTGFSVRPRIRINGEEVASGAASAVGSHARWVGILTRINNVIYTTVHDVANTIGGFGSITADTEQNYYARDRLTRLGAIASAATTVRIEHVSGSGGTAYSEPGVPLA